MDRFDDRYADGLDQQDPLRHLREEFLIPTRGQLKRTVLENTGESIKESDVGSCTYLCGNSLGLQPKLVAKYTAAYHETWATKGVYGHFKRLTDSPLEPWLDTDDAVAEDMGKIVGARKEEVAVMQTLTANLHLAMATFYRPSKERYKIIMESKAFPSDHYAIESQILHHGLSPEKAMITIEPPTDTPTLTTSHILSVIDQHAESTALICLPAIQFYTGQFFDLATITAHAHRHGILVGWDLAHAVGNVPLSLHDWNVDFAVWCNYKYLNCGPGAIGGLFVHARHSVPTDTTDTENDAGRGTKPPPPPPPPSATTPARRPLIRLAGWWGSSKSTRFAMTNTFEPIPGAAGWQLSNPSVADLTAVRASLDVFARTDMVALRRKSLALTEYLEELLDGLLSREKELGAGKGAAGPSFEIITPRDQAQRGAQLSVRLAGGLLDGVMEVLEREGVVVDERRPDVVRVAPAPLYNNAADCLRFARVFVMAIEEARRHGTAVNGGAGMAGGGKDAKGWSEVK